MGAKPLIFISQDQYIQKAYRVWGLLDPYTPKTYHVSCIHYPLDGVRCGVCNTPLPSFLVLIQEKKAKENQGLYRGRGS